jgi:hypothetical protein
VVFTYQDRAMQAGLALSVLACLGILALCIWRRRRARRADGPRVADGPADGARAVAGPGDEPSTTAADPTANES